MSDLPLCSSDQIVNALRRAGFEPARSASGSHQAYVRTTAGRKYIAIVVIGKRQVPRGTLRSILKQAGLTVEEFLTYLR